MVYLLKYKFNIQVDTNTIEEILLYPFDNKIFKKSLLRMEALPVLMSDSAFECANFLFIFLRHFS